MNDFKNFPLSKRQLLPYARVNLGKKDALVAISFRKLADGLNVIKHKSH